MILGIIQKPCGPIFGNFDPRTLGIWSMWTAWLPAPLRRLFEKPLLGPHGLCMTSSCYHTKKAFLKTFW